MEINQSNVILAVVTDRAGKVLSGGAPVFLAEDSAEKDRCALLLARILNGYVHDLENGTFIIVRH